MNTKKYQLGLIAFFLSNYFTREYATALSKMYNITTEEADSLIVVNESLVVDSIHHSTYDFMSTLGINSQEKILEVINYLIEHRITKQDDKHDHGDYVRCIINMISLLDKKEEKLLNKVYSLFEKISYPWNHICLLENTTDVLVPSDVIVKLSMKTIPGIISGPDFKPFKTILFNRKFTKEQKQELQDLVYSSEYVVMKIGGYTSLNSLHVDTEPILIKVDKPCYDKLEFLVQKPNLTDDDISFIRDKVNKSMNRGNTTNTGLEYNIDFILKILSYDEMKTLFAYCVKNFREESSSNVVVAHKIAEFYGDDYFFKDLEPAILAKRIQCLESSLFYALKPHIEKFKPRYFTSGDTHFREDELALSISDLSIDPEDDLNARLRKECGIKQNITAFDTVADIFNHLKCA